MSTCTGFCILLSATCLECFRHCGQCCQSKGRGKSGTDGSQKGWIGKGWDQAEETQTVASTIKRIITIISTRVYFIEGLQYCAHWQILLIYKSAYKERICKVYLLCMKGGCQRLSWTSLDPVSLDIQWPSRSIRAHSPVWGNERQPLGNGDH